MIQNRIRATLLALTLSLALMTLLVACTATMPSAPEAPVAEATAPAATGGASTPTEAAEKALIWLRSQQAITDSSFGGSAVTSVENLLAIGAAHENVNEWRPAADAPSLLDFVLAHGAEYSLSGVSEAGKLAVALSGVEACWPADAVKPSRASVAYMAARCPHDR